MSDHDKSAMLEQARSELATTAHAIERKLADYARSLEKESEAYKRIKGETAYEDRARAFAVGANTTLLRDQLLALDGSPYFARCDVDLDGAGTTSYYFGKYGSSDLGVYSWTSPLATIRFADPGPVSYEPPDGRMVAGTLSRRDQFLIAQNQIRFMASETLGSDRDLIYQEHFSQRKAGFVLPEIVAQMEQAQDRVIRAPHRGSFVISGPAGSGKTTLALHRVAFLRSSPETADLYPPEDVLVLVQDYRTQGYFSHLLPELGIHDVNIMTFNQWALKVLGLRRHFYRERPGADQREQDRYESAKLRARVELPETKLTEAGIGKVLRKLYEPYLDAAQMALLRGELADGALDRHDLTNLLRLSEMQDGSLTREVESHTFLPSGRVRTKVTRESLRYALILADEFQNYLPAQLRLLRQAVAGRNDAILYVGDLGQQTRFGAVRDWNQFGEVIAADRQIRLHKVYRNTEQIMRFVGRLGFTVTIPDGVAQGPEVELVSGDAAAGIARLTELMPEGTATLGIIAADATELESYRIVYGAVPGVLIMTINEAQGVEFDTVVLVGVRPPLETGDDTADHVAERRRIDRDLLYVALTRAISRLFIVGYGDAEANLRLIARNCDQ